MDLCIIKPLNDVRRKFSADHNVRWPVRAVFTSNFQFQNCTLHTSKSHIAHFEIPNCALHTSKSHIAHFEIPNCALHTSKSHIAHFQTPNCTLHTSKSHIVHFQIQSCTLRISKLHTSNFQIAHFELRTSKISQAAFSALLKNGLVTLFSASLVNVGLRILSHVIPLDLYRARTNLIRWRSTGRFDGLQSCNSRL